MALGEPNRFPEAELLRSNSQFPRTSEDGLDERFYACPPPNLSPHQLREFIGALQKLLQGQEDDLRDARQEIGVLEKDLERCQEDFIHMKRILEGTGSRSSSSSSRIPDKEFKKWVQLDIPNTSRSGGLLADLVIVYDPLDQSIRKLSRAYFPEQYYVKIELPTFHWWSDEITIYRAVESLDSAKGKPQLSARKHPKALEGHNRVATIPLGKLGLDIKLQRMLGKIKFLYMLSTPPSQVEVRSTNRL